MSLLSNRDDLTHLAIIWRIFTPGRMALIKPLLELEPGLYKRDFYQPARYISATVSYSGIVHQQQQVRSSRKDLLEVRDRWGRQKGFDN